MVNQATQVAAYLGQMCFELHKIAATTAELGLLASILEIATDVHWTMSGEVVLMTLVGGLGPVFGPVVGAFVIIAMQQYLAGFGQWGTVIQGGDFRDLRAHLPPRRHRRNRTPFQKVAVETSLRRQTIIK